MPIVRLDQVSLSYGLKPLLDHVDLQIDPGERLCLLGRNGEGKSSLLGMLTGKIKPDSGEVWVRPGTRIAALAQESGIPGCERVHELLHAGLAAHEHLDSWQLKNRIETIQSHLSLPGEARIDELSGGWRRRVMLGCALVVEPDLLLLDEPTNHLDIDAIVWLEEFLRDFAGAILFVSHDRAFLRRLASRTIDLDRGKLSSWPGGYDDYLAHKRESLEVEARHAALFDKKLAQEEAWIRQGVEARRTRNEGRVRALKKLRLEQRARRDRPGSMAAQVQDAERSGKLVFDIERVGLELGGRRLINDFSARIMRGDRIGILGANGSGKTSLIKLLMGEIEPSSGVIRRGTSLKPAYFDQQREQLDPNASIMDNVTGGTGDTVVIDGRSRHVSGYLREFLFPPERLNAPVNMLSGGERNRLLLARLFAKPTNLLIMDEPTNDLDVDTLDLLEELIAEFQGTLLLVSHDREFLDHVVTSTLVFEREGVLKEYVGGYTDWLQQRNTESAGGRRGRTNPSSRRTAALPAATKAAKPPQKLSYKEQLELTAAPERIQSLENELSELQRRVNDAAFYRQAPEHIAAELQRLEALSRQLEASYARWQALDVRARSE